MLQQLKMEDFSSVNVQILGAEDTYGPHAQSKPVSSFIIIYSTGLFLALSSSTPQPVSSFIIIYSTACFYFIIIYSTACF
ncbi:hypothetical protein JOQ06_012978 [Pogonophryne albipinna]|uniref:Uncharacterized protein n=1 Tax=Pogonophryne albipinna TaxID=1090488 RepID=A0AAD6FQV5_9TELE|nr:hypothetical protein JOQ06_012978 [Pogonophryne albipinna]